MRPRLWASLLMLGVLLLGCPDDKKKTEDPEPDPYMKQTSIANCLFNLKLSYTQRNVAKFSNLLADDFTFVFDPRDVGHDGIPESWGKPDEIISATNLLDSLQNADGYVCESISLNFEAGAVVQSPVFVAWKNVTLSQIQLFVDSRYQSDGLRLIYEVLGDQADLSFIQTAETDPSSGLKIWKIIQWVDRPVVFKTGTEPTTWGKIKAIWR